MNVYSERFAGQCAIVTGAASGIGLGIAKRLTSEGARVSAWDVSEDALKGIIGSVAQTVHVDQSDEDAVAQAAARAFEELGHIEVLIVSAGITGPNVPLAQYPSEDWRRVMNVNVDGTFFVNRAVVPHMLSRNYGRIINIASVAGKEGNPNASAYSASKAAVIGLSKSLAKELAQTGITVNVVTPAAVRTPIFDQMSREHIDYMLSKIPAGRFGRIEEIASLVAWIASQENSFATGAVFDISGGRSTY